MSLQLIVEFRPRPELIEEVESRVAEFVARMDEESGCTSTSFSRVDGEPPRYVVLAEFADDDALRFHLEEDWRQEAVADLLEMLAEMPERNTMKRVA